MDEGNCKNISVSPFIIFCRQLAILEQHEIGRLDCLTDYPSVQENAAKWIGKYVFMTMNRVYNHEFIPFDSCLI